MTFFLGFCLGLGTGIFGVLILSLFARKDHKVEELKEKAAEHQKTGL